MSLIVNFYGGPGTGKSTSAAYFFYLAKAKGINAELVREYVKEWAWEGRTPGPFDQLYFLGKQARKESMLYGKVDLIVTDCPILYNTYYSKKFGPPGLAAGIDEAVKSYYATALSTGQMHEHVFLERSKEYNPSGRYQTESEAKAMDSEIFNLVKEMSGSVYVCPTTMRALNTLFDTVVAKYALL